MQKKLSIITINLNNLEGLKKTLQSVLSQTYQDFEYIVIDGGSTDGSKELIEQYQDKISYWVSEPDSGIYNAMNKGIKQANGEYLLFLNGDDYLIDNSVLQRISHHLEDKDLIYFDIYYGHNNNLKMATYPDKLSFYFFYTGTICHQAVFFKKGLFTKFGLYDEQLKIVSDWKFIMLSIVKYHASYKHVSDVFCVFDNRGISSTIDGNGQFNKIHYEERQQVIMSEFFYFAEDYKQFELLRYYFIKYKLNVLKHLLISLKKIFKSKFYLNGLLRIWN